MILRREDSPAQSKRYRDAFNSGRGRQTLVSIPVIMRNVH
jgi:hypothetical protein